MKIFTQWRWLLAVLLLAGLAATGLQLTMSVRDSEPEYALGWNWQQEARERDATIPWYAPGPAILNSAAILESVDLRRSTSYPEAYNQGRLGSCTANAVTFLAHYDLIKQGLDAFNPSRLYTYYFTRRAMLTWWFDSGATLRGTVRCLISHGFAHESLWPYDIKKFRKKPAAAAIEDGKQNRVLEYRRVRQNLDDIKAALADGNPVAFGFMVYSSIRSEQVKNTGVVPLPGIGEELLGGHAVAIVGFIEKDQLFIVRNSWGKEWGPLDGHFLMPYAYVLDSQLASDFWVITLVSEGGKK